VILLPEIVLPLTVRDLTAADLPACRWSGGRSHLGAIAGELDRAARGESEYLVVCPPSGLPVALGGIDYVKIPGAGVLWQLAVHGMLQSCGIGTILIQAAEQRGGHRAPSHALVLRVHLKQGDPGRDRELQQVSSNEASAW
jgi:GNAT superfamily N-acetyltransferase